MSYHLSVCCSTRVLYVAGFSGNSPNSNVGCGPSETDSVKCFTFLRKIFENVFCKPVTNFVLRVSSLSTWVSHAKFKMAVQNMHATMQNLKVNYILSISIQY